MIGEKVRNLLARLGLAPKREWAIVSPEDVRAEMEQKRAELLSRHGQEMADYNDREPLHTADVADITKWEKEGEILPETHKKELVDFDNGWGSFAIKVEGLSDLYREYVRIYAELEASTKEASESAETELQSLEKKRVSLEAAKAQIEKTHSEIVERLREMGAETALGSHFDGWERAVLRAFYVEACHARHIDPDKGPSVPRMPELPKPIKPVTNRTIQEKPFTVWDIPMLVGGLAFGSSAGAAVGGISFDSDGWHFSPIFWLLLSVATIAAFMVGKVLFHRLIAVRAIDSIDVYPYLPDETRQTEKRKQARASRFAGAGIVAVFAVFCITDFYGWWRAVTEQNAAYAGDTGSVVLNAVFAGIAVAFLTVLMASVKLASVASIVNQRRNELQDEVKANTAAYVEATRRYEADMEEYNRLRAIAEEYQRLAREANANAEFRFRRETKGIRQQIADYLVALEKSSPDEIMLIDRQMDEVVERLLAELQPKRDEVGMVGDQIDQIVSDYDRLQLGPQPREKEPWEEGLNSMWTASSTPLPEE
jgi:uncharacterized membrane protein